MRETKKTAILAPRLPRVPERLDRPHPLRLEEEEQLEDGVLEDTVVTAEGAAKVRLDRLVLRNVRFEGAALPQLEGTDLLFERCDLSNADFSESILHRTAFVNCKLTGTVFAEATLRNVTFTDCLAPYANFRFSDLKQVRFDGCSLEQADFTSCEWAKLELKRTRLEGAQLSRTKLEGIDLRDCEFTSIGVTPHEVSGCIIAPEQAASFARLLGVVIKR
ncbi:hypothetical protein J31TS4_04380 [Paenibacillus sp. J31TS4]|uniref:pentapeptide repeat-containing protein n=1 Tax=Paenibacillus sp. J31TS4 TaxID=2807195 RepID=UPI001B06D358|nr:pentapeptide repeat-containing protein [Paenibacillus sp. J31TS4]GIP37158.1 hypothetical protein J31TS4_04380 [Paenibacillus sp. J31TS4]